MFRIEWVRDDARRHDIGGSPLFAPGPVATLAGEYVTKWIWPQIHRQHPEISGFALVDLQSQDEVFRWKHGHDIHQTWGDEAAKNGTAQALPASGTS
jgi:hypothetical protein